MKPSGKKLLLSFVLFFVVSVFTAKNVAVSRYLDAVRASCQKSLQFGMPDLENCHFSSMNIPAGRFYPEFSIGFLLQILIVNTNEWNIPDSVSDFGAINLFFDFMIFYLISSLIIFFQA